MTLDELETYGMVRMSDDDIRDMLSSRGIGVLALPNDDTPYMVPMSYGFDGESTLYFTFVLGGESMKRQLADAADAASFLVYSADTMFMWESVFLTGTIDELSETEREAVEDLGLRTWRPALFESAGAEETVTIYAFEIDDRVGIRHSGLPPGFERQLDEPHTE